MRGQYMAVPFVVFGKRVLGTGSVSPVPGAPVRFRRGSLSSDRDRSGATAEQLDRWQVVMDPILGRPRGHCFIDFLDSRQFVTGFFGWFDYVKQVLTMSLRVFTCLYQVNLLILWSWNVLERYSYVLKQWPDRGLCLGPFKTLSF